MDCNIHKQTQEQRQRVNSYKRLMGTSKRETDNKKIEELIVHFKNVPTEQLLNYRFSPRGYLDKVIKKALHQELKAREMSNK